jgi:hypothetical protein
MPARERQDMNAMKTAATTENLRITARKESPLAGRLTRWLRRVFPASANADVLLRLEGRLSLGPKKTLLLVDCCGKKVLLAVSGDTIVPVLEFARPKRRVISARPAETGAVR